MNQLFGLQHRREPSRDLLKTFNPRAKKASPLHFRRGRLCSSKCTIGFFDLKVRSVACAIRCALSTRRETRGVF